MKELEAADS